MSPSPIEYQTVVLAALLHDIGKFLQRGSFGPLDVKGKHPEVSARFVTARGNCFSGVADLDLLRTLVQRHHESPHFPPELKVQDISDPQVRALAYLVSTADNLSAAERGQESEQWQDFKDTPLASVLERINHIEEAGAGLRYGASAFGDTGSLEAAFPKRTDSYAAGELNSLLRSFGQEFDALFLGEHAVVTQDFDGILHHLLNILYRYTWCIPSNTQEEIPDVSLFDHLKTTAAIASCLYQYHIADGSLNERGIRDKDAQRFCLVVGDISGIQNYIFDIATGGTGGIARRLRARSLYVQLCSEVAAHMVLGRLELPLPTHTIMNSGGRFYLLLPNVVATQQTVIEVQRSIDSWFLKELNGELSLNLASIRFGNDGFETSGSDNSGFGHIVQKANEQLNIRKRQRFAATLSGRDGWDERSFVLNASFEGKEDCVSCHKFPADADGLCIHCKRDQGIGARLPAAKYLAFFEDATAGDIPVLGYSVSVRGAAGNAERARPYLITKLNDADLRELASFPAASRYVAKFVAVRGNSEVATFEDIAGASSGQHLLGFLKADVDSLGEAFVYGLRGDNQRADSISRTTTFSRMLDLFFSGWVEHLTSEGKDFYTVYSGGDDLFVIGPWDKTLKLASQIESDFRRFTGSPALTMSAAVVLARHDYPISSAATALEDALNQAKDPHRNDRQRRELEDPPNALNQAKDPRPDVHGDRICVLGRPLHWPEWAKVQAEWQALLPTVGGIPSAFLYALLEYADMWRRYKEDGDVLGLRYHPLLAYNVARNVDARKNPELARWASALLNLRVSDPRQSFLLDNLGLLATLLIYSKRGGDE